MNYFWIGFQFASGVAVFALVFAFITAILVFIKDRVDWYLIRRAYRIEEEERQERKRQWEEKKRKEEKKKSNESGQGRVLKSGIKSRRKRKEEKRKNRRRGRECGVRRRRKSKL